MSYVSRHNEVLIYEAFEHSFITTVLGPRRVGKSTLIQSFISKHPELKWVKLNMDERALRQSIQLGNLQRVIEEESHTQIGVGEKVWVVIDEAQKCPELFEQVKVLYDDWKGQNLIKFILTGSGHLELHHLSAESLAGRIELFYLHEFTLREMLSLQTQLILPETSLLDLLLDQEFSHFEQAASQIAPVRKELVAGINQELVWGGLPEMAVFKDIKEKQRYLANYLQTYLEKDIRAIKSIGDLNAFQQLIDISAEQTGSIRDDSKVLQSLSCSRDTLKKYRGYLLATLMYQDIYPFIGTSLKRLIKSPKGYLLNNGLISYTTGIYRIDILIQSGLVGHRFENWLLKELSVALGRRAVKNEIYFWRTSSGVEVDFVIQEKPYIYPFEITYSQQIQRKKMNNLKRFMELEPKAKTGFYIYMGDYFYDADSNIYCLPAWMIS